MQLFLSFLLLPHVEEATQQQKKKLNFAERRRKITVAQFGMNAKNAAKCARNRVGKQNYISSRRVHNRVMIRPRHKRRRQGSRGGVGSERGIIALVTSSGIIVVIFAF